MPRSRDSRRQAPSPAGGPRSRSANDPDLSRPEILELLRAAPGRLAELTAGMSADDLRTPPSPGAWSLVEILAHLRACEDAWGDPIGRILAEDRPTFRAVNPRTWIDRTDYRAQPFDASLRAFAEHRAGLVATLGSLPPEAWQRSAIVTGAGAVLERTITWYALGLAAHERSHLRHVARLRRSAG